MPDFEQIGVEAVVAGMSPFRRDAAAYNAGILSMAGVTRTASTGINALGQIAIGAQRYIGQLAVDGFRLAAREALRFAENVISAAAAGTPLASSLSTLYEHIQGIAKSQLAPFFDQFGDLVNRAAPAIESFTQFALGALGNLGSDALVWGENVVNQFAQGMWNAVGAVLDALANIASQVAYWLAPGSPPKLLPDLTNWGKGAVQAYLDGWSQGDFSNFTELAGSIESYLRSLSTDPNDTGLIPRILGTREAIAQAVNQVRQTGVATQEVMDGIFAAAGANTAAMRGYVKSVFDLELANANVSAAQASLNQVTKEYDDLLKPLGDKIAGISEEQAQLAEDNRISQLKLIANDPNATASEKRQAQLEIERVLAERQRRAMLLEKAAAVDASQAKVDAAKDAQGAAVAAFDAQKAQLALNTQQNELIKAQIALLERLAKVTATPPGPKPAQGGKGGGGGGVKPFTTEFDWKKLIPDSIWDRLGALQDAFEKAWAAILRVLQPAIDAWNNLVVPAWKNLVAAIVGSLPALQAAIARMVAFVIKEMGIALPVVFANVASSLNSLAQIWRNHSGTVIAIVEFLFRLVAATISGTMILISGIIALALNTIAGTFDLWSAVFRGDWAAVWEVIKTTVATDLAIVQRTIVGVLDAAFAIFGIRTADILRVWRQVFDLLPLAAAAALARVLAVVTPAVEAVRAIIDSKIAAARDFFQTAMDQIVTAISGPLIALGNLMLSIAGLYNWLSSHVFNFKINLPDLPDWATPGSPTPFEIGLRGIAAALKEVDSVASKSFAGLRNPMAAASSPMAVAAPAVAGPATTFNRSTTYTLGGVNTQRQADSIIHEFAIMQVMAGIPA